MLILNVRREVEKRTYLGRFSNTLFAMETVRQMFPKGLGLYEKNQFGTRVKFTS